MSDNEIADIFGKMDKDGDGKVTFAEFMEFCKKGGLGKLSDDDVGCLCEAFIEADVNKDQVVSKDEFLNYYKKVDRKISYDKDKDIRSWFNQCDIDKDGVITIQELEACIRKLQIPDGKKQALSAMKKFDSNNDGQLTYPEFKALFLHYFKSPTG